MISYNPVGTSATLSFSKQLSEPDLNNRTDDQQMSETPNSYGSLESIDSQFKSETDSELGTPTVSVKESLSSETFITQLCKTLEKAKDIPITVSFDAEDPYVTVNQSSSPVPTDEIQLVSFRRTTSPPADEHNTSEQKPYIINEPATLSLNTAIPQQPKITTSDLNSPPTRGSTTYNENNCNLDEKRAPSQKFPQAQKEKNDKSSELHDKLKEIRELARSQRSNLPTKKINKGSFVLEKDSDFSHGQYNPYNSREGLNSQNSQAAISSVFKTKNPRTKPPIGLKPVLGKQEQSTPPFRESKMKLKESPKPFLRGSSLPATPTSFVPKQDIPKVPRKTAERNETSESTENSDALNTIVANVPGSDKNQSTVNPSSAQNPHGICQELTKLGATVTSRPGSTGPIPPVRKSSLGEIAPPIPPRPDMAEPLIPPIPCSPDLSKLTPRSTEPPPPPPRHYLLTPRGLTEKKKEPPIVPPRSASLLRGTPPLSQTSKQASPISTPSLLVTSEPTSEKSSFYKERSSSPFSLLESVPEETTSSNSSIIQSLNDLDDEDSSPKNAEARKAPSSPVDRMVGKEEDMPNSGTPPDVPAAPLPPSKDSPSLITISPYGKVVVDRVDLPLPSPNEEVRKCVRSAVEWDWLSPTQPIISLYRQTPPLIQKGPQCGLVALQMACQIFEVSVELDTLLEGAQALKISNHGEMFSAEDFCELSNNLVSSLKAEVRELSKISPQDVWSVLADGSIILAPYDANKNHMPGAHKGHRAHWALICGCLLQGVDVKAEEFIHLGEKDTEKENLVHLLPENLKEGLSSKLDKWENINLMLLWRQGKSRGLIMSSFEDFIESNRQLLEYPETDEYVIKSVKEGLNGKCIVISHL